MSQSDKDECKKNWFNYIIVYLCCIKNQPFCAHAFSVFLPAWKQRKWVVSLSFFFFSNQLWFTKQTDITSVYMWGPDPGKPAWNDARLSPRTTMTAVPSAGQGENSYWCPEHLASSHSPSLCQKPGGIHKNLFTVFKYLYRFACNHLFPVCSTSFVTSHHTYQPLRKHKLMITL